ENRFDIHDRSAVDRLQTLDVKPAVPIDSQDLRAVQTDRIRPIGRTSCEHPGQRVPNLASRVYLENGSSRLMKPGKNPDLLPGLNSMEALDESRIDLQFSIGRPFPSLAGRAGAFLERRANPADRRDLEGLGNFHPGSIQRRPGNRVPHSLAIIL